MQRTAYELRIREIEKKIIVTLRVATSFLQLRSSVCLPFLCKINLILISVSETQKCKQPSIEELIKLMKERPQDVKAQLTGCRCMGQFAYDGTTDLSFRWWGGGGDCLWFLMVGFVFIFFFYSFWNMIRQLHVIST